MWLFDLTHCILMQRGTFPIFNGIRRNYVECSEWQRKIMRARRGEGVSDGVIFTVKHQTYLVVLN